MQVLPSEFPTWKVLPIWNGQTTIGHLQFRYIGACLQSLLQTTDIPATSLAIAHLPLTQGGLVLMSATILAAPAYWSSWADTLPVLQAHLPELTHQILEQLTHSQASPALQAATDAARTLAATGWEPPTWAAIASSQT